VLFCGCDEIFDLEHVGPSGLDAPAACTTFVPAVWVARPAGLSGTDPTLVSTGTEIVITRGGELWTTTWSDPFWNNPTLLDELNDSSPDDSPAFLPDDDFGLWWSTGVGGRIKLARRSSDIMSWVDTGHVPGFEPATDDHQTGPPTARGLGRVVASHRRLLAPDAELELFEFENRSGTYVAVDPATTFAVNSPAADRDPHLSRDGCALLFSSDRDGTYDLFLATRPHVGAPFDPPTKLELSIGTADQETGPWLMQDDRLYFARGASGVEEIYVATPAAM
jgi:hypothetical protein